MSDSRKYKKPYSASYYTYKGIFEEVCELDKNFVKKNKLLTYDEFINLKDNVEFIFSVRKMKKLIASNRKYPGAKIRMARQKYGIRQNELCNFLGIKQNTLSDMEYNIRNNVTDDIIDHLTNICKIIYLRNSIIKIVDFTKEILENTTKNVTIEEINPSSSTYFTEIQINRSIAVKKRAIIKNSEDIRKILINRYGSIRKFSNENKIQYNYTISVLNGRHMYYEVMEILQKEGIIVEYE